MSRERLRILYLIPDFRKGGAERFLIDLCTELQRRDDVEFRIGVLFDHNQYTGLTEDFTIENLYYEPFSLRGKNENRHYRRLLETFRPHIVHTHLFLAEFLSSYYVDRTITFVCHGHDNMRQFKNLHLNTFFDKTKLLEYYEKRYLINKKYKHSETYFVANSTHTRAFYQKMLPGKMKDNVKLIACGFNYGRFYTPGEKKIKPDEPLRILNVGSYQDKKNQLFIVDIADELRKHTVDFEINLIGEGQNFEKVKHAIADRNLEKQVRQLGIMDDVQDYYRLGDLYLHTAWYEPFGLALLEAMAAGLPVITLDGKGNRDIIENGKNGFIFYEQNAGKFASSIIDLYENPARYAAMSAYAKEYAAQFEIKDKTQELLDYYYSIIR